MKISSGRCVVFLKSQNTPTWTNEKNIALRLRVRVTAVLFFSRRVRRIGHQFLDLGALHRNCRSTSKPRANTNGTACRLCVRGRLSPSWDGDLTNSSVKQQNSTVSIRNKHIIPSFMTKNSNNRRTTTKHELSRLCLVSRSYPFVPSLSHAFS